MSKIDEILWHGQPVRPLLEPIIREILALVAHPPEGAGDKWEGADTKFGTDAEIMDQAMEIISRHLVLPAGVDATVGTVNSVAAAIGNAIRFTGFDGL